MILSPNAFLIRFSQLQGHTRGLVGLRPWIHQFGIRILVADYSWHHRSRQCSSKVAVVGPKRAEHRELYLPYLISVLSVAIVSCSLNFVVSIGTEFHTDRSYQSKLIFVFRRYSDANCDLYPYRMSFKFCFRSPMAGRARESAAVCPLSTIHDLNTTTLPPEQHITSQIGKIEFQ